ncbi:hypothetical protein DL95DRAFT_473428 [Leptodontidium sp. 2 PMI_412]|nr:hypothetical protein DL95DRAFT_473428 [Leptodontidium sp. 2 PMI_412]
MQISGVYRNCICYAGSENWYNVTTKNPMIQVANDTEAARNASQYWIWMRVFAAIFLAFNCYIGWWYQMFNRRRFTEVVKNMFVPSLIVIRGADPAPGDVAGDAADSAGNGTVDSDLADGINLVVNKPVWDPVPVRPRHFRIATNASR